MTSASEKELYILNTSINKALKPIEAPLKMKHARSIIITTHRTKEAKSFWMVIVRQPVMENRFTAWKFCHLLHKLLREGHESCLSNSQTHKILIYEMGKLWGHLEDGVGHCIQAYSKLIVNKLEFHYKNAIFPGSLLVNFEKIENFANNDINIYFQLCVEVFDYLDGIIDVQSKIFSSTNTYRMSSMTPQGQCRLAPLITLIQDSNPLYDICVRIMFKLHNQLPSDTLSGHRNRFRDLFFKLKIFYDNVRPLQYFANLIQVPLLPEEVPNFTSKIDFGSYIPPVVFVQPDADLSSNTLVDPSILQDPPKDKLILQNNDKIKIDELENVLQQKQLIIDKMQDELNFSKVESKLIEEKLKNDIACSNEEISVLKNEIIRYKESCMELEAMRDKFDNQITNSPIILEKSSEELQKPKASEEKFTKLKNMYTQIRDEHINLLRQHGDINKSLNKELQINSALKNKLSQLETQILTYKNELKKSVDLTAKNDALGLMLNESKSNYESLVMKYEILIGKQLSLEMKRQIEIKQFNFKVGQLEKKAVDVKKYEYKNLNLEKCLSDAEKALDEQSKEYEKEILTLKSKITSELIFINELERDHEIGLKAKEGIIEELEQSFQKQSNQLKEKENDFHTLIKEMEIIKINSHDLIESNKILENKLTNTELKLKSMTTANENNETNYKNKLFSLLHSVLKTVEILVELKFNDLNTNSLQKTIKYVHEINLILDKSSTFDKFYLDAELAQEFLLLGYYFIMLHDQCILISNTSANINKSEDIMKKLSCLSEPLLSLFQIYTKDYKTGNAVSCVSTIKKYLSDILLIMNELVKNNIETLEYEELLEIELTEMDKAVEEATDKFIFMLKNTRANNNGIQLEVNEKILDACTNLMKCIKLLIQKSKVLQEEIVCSGRGSTSVTEFYKRNSQWTEGLISASKSVAKGANLLVDVANKVVSGEKNENFEIIVAAQEIAACTAQLVISSKVKAPKGSQKLMDLTKVSRCVSEATGVVVATVKEYNQHLEQLKEYDLSKLSSSQVKTMEMELHVKVLELEQALETERFKLTSFRRTYYKRNDL